MAGRPSIFRIRYGFHYADDLIFGTYSAKWLELKRLLKLQIRRYGTDASRTEDIVRLETRCLLEEISKHDGHAFDPSLVMMTSVVNALSASVKLCLLLRHCDSLDNDIKFRVLNLFS